MKRIISTLLAVVMFVSLFAITGSAASMYSDVDGHWGQSYVEYYSEKGVVNGYPDGTFRPDAKITRAEAAQVLMNYFKFTGQGKGFTDVFPTDWYYNAVLASQKNGAFEGYEDGSFKPQSNITREEVIVLLRRITTAEENMELGKHFVDYDDVCGWAKGSVGALREVGVLDGYQELPNTYFVRVHRLITRAEFVKLLFTIERSNKVDWQIPGSSDEGDGKDDDFMGGGGGDYTPTNYYNVAVSITGPDVNNGDAITTVGPLYRYADISTSTSEDGSPVLADVFQVLTEGHNISGKDTNGNPWNYTTAFQVAFGNNLARCILKDMVNSYTGSSFVRSWNYYVNDVTTDGTNWKNLFQSNITVGYGAAVGTNSAAASSNAGYKVETSFTTPTDPAVWTEYANAYTGGSQNGFYGGKTYTVTLVLFKS